MQKKRKKWPIVLAIVMVVVAAGGFGVWQYLQIQQAEASKPVVVDTQASIGNVQTTVAASGTLAANTATVEIPTGVTVSEQLKATDATVAAGDALATLDTSSITSRISTVTDRLDSINDELDDIADGTKETIYIKAQETGKVNAVNVKVGSDVAKVLKSKDALIELAYDGKSSAAVNITANAGEVSKVYVSKGDTVYAGSYLLAIKRPVATTAKATLKAERKDLLAELSTLNSLVADPTLYAPVAGTVGAATSSELSVIDSKKMTIDVTVDELDIASVKEGQTAAVTLDALSEQTFEGVVTEVVTEPASSDSGSGSSVAGYSATITLNKADGMLVGMSASASIVKQSKSDVVTVPLVAVQNFGNRSFVYTALDAQGQPTGEADITTGLSDGTNVEVTSGLADGQTVYYVRAAASAISNATQGGSAGFSMGMSAGGGGPVRETYAGPRAQGSGSTPSGSTPSGAAPAPAPAG
jgi:multidrug efflux pump subunit AcrA (membrane-fusion protein)